MVSILTMVGPTSGGSRHHRGPRVCRALNSRNAGLFPAIFGRFRRFFVKMADKSTSFSGFLFRIEFLVVDCIKNDYDLDNDIVSWRIFEI